MTDSACNCGDPDCMHHATGYPFCRPCDEHHRAPECLVDEHGEALAPSGHPWSVVDAGPPPSDDGATLAVYGPDRATFVYGVEWTDSDGGRHRVAGDPAAVAASLRASDGQAGPEAPPAACSPPPGGRAE